MSKRYMTVSTCEGNALLDFDEDDEDTMSEKSYTEEFYDGSGARSESQTSSEPFNEHKTTDSDDNHIHHKSQHFSNNSKTESSSSLFISTISNFQSAISAILNPIIIKLPAPLGQRRAENKLMYFFASLSLALFALHNVVSSPKFHHFSIMKQQTKDYDLAYRESMGFFDDISSSVWMEKKRRVKSQPRNNDEKFGLRSKFAYRNHPQIWYQNNFEAEFICPHEIRVGGTGDGAKWTCDPHRIKAVASKRSGSHNKNRIKPTNIHGNENGENGCLIYSIGRGMPQNPTYFDFTYELAILDILGGPGSCEIHIFDHLASRYRGVVPDGLILHPWGLEGQVDSSRGRRDYLTLKETVDYLGHAGREIDVFKVDCEACEWHTFREWFDSGVTMRQILVELHGAPRNEDNFFETLEKNDFVIFHKEADTQYGGIWQEYGFLRLSHDFFE